MMTQDADFTFAINTSSTALASDFLDPIQFHPWTWEDELTYVNEGEFKPARDENGALYEGEPCKWTIIGTTAYVDVTCDAAFPRCAALLRAADGLVRIKRDQFPHHPLSVFAQVRVHGQGL